MVLGLKFHHYVKDISPSSSIKTFLLTIAALAKTTGKPKKENRIDKISIQC